MAFIAVALISLSKTHYTIDLVIAYFATTTVFRIYHTAVRYPELLVGLRYRVSNKSNRVLVPGIEWLELFVKHVVV